MFKLFPSALYLFWFSFLFQHCVKLPLLPLFALISHYVRLFCLLHGFLHRVFFTYLLFIFVIVLPSSHFCRCFFPLSIFHTIYLLFHGCFLLTCSPSSYFKLSRVLSLLSLLFSRLFFRDLLLFTLLFTVSVSRYHFYFYEQCYTAFLFLFSHFCTTLFCVYYLH